MGSISLNLISRAAATILFSVAGASGSAMHWQELVPTSGLWKGQALVVLENDLVSVTFLPRAVVDWSDTSTRQRPSITFRKMGELTSEGAGGVWDKEGVWPTTNISNHPFTHRVLQSSDRLEAVFEAHLGNLTIVRHCWLTCRSTGLAVETTYQNTGPLPMRSPHRPGLSSGARRDCRVRGLYSLPGRRRCGQASFSCAVIGGMRSPFAFVVGGERLQAERILAADG